MLFQGLLTIILIALAVWFVYTNLIAPSAKGILQKKPKPEKIQKKMEVLTENKDKLKEVKEEIKITEELREVSDELTVNSETLDILDKSLQPEENEKEEKKE